MVRATRTLGRILGALTLVALTSTAAGPAGGSVPAAGSGPRLASAAAAVAPVWSAPVTAIPDRGQPSDVSCPTTTWCMAVDRGGRAMTFNGSTWGAATLVFPRVDSRNDDIRAVSCPTTSFCLAVAAHSYGVYRSGVWTVVASPLAPFHAVDCFSATRCAVVGGDYYSPRKIGYWNGSTIVGVVTAPWASRVDAVSCPSATTCHGIGVASDGGAIALRSSGSGWVATFLNKVSFSSTFDISCTSTTFCLATSGSSYRTWRWNGSTWRYAGDAQSGMLLDVETLSCTSPTSCQAAGDMRVGRWNGSAWSIRAITSLYGAEYSLDCPSASTCLIVDDRGRFMRGGGSTWTPAVGFDPTSGWVVDLSCPTDTFCMAADDLGNAVRWNGVGWTGLTRLGNRPSSVSCLSATWCMTVDMQQGTYRLWTGAWGKAIAFDSINPNWPLACASTTACFTFQDGDVRRWNGKTWSAPTRLFSDFRRPEVACRGPRFCIAMTYDGLFRTWNGTSWSAVRRSGVTEANQLSCTSTGFCIVASSTASFSTFNGSTWSVRRVLPSASDRLACQNSKRCLTTGIGGTVWTWDGSTWTESPTKLAFEPFKLACTPTRCVAVGYEKSSWTL
ncbi:hypothetical protein ACWEOW_18880 [Monashia sp. NPDC004114]